MEDLKNFVISLGSSLAFYSKKNFCFLNRTLNFVAIGFWKIPELILNSERYKSI